jgi:hypothetical protein
MQKFLKIRPEITLKKIFNILDKTSLVNIICGNDEQYFQNIGCIYIQNVIFFKLEVQTN